LNEAAQNLQAGYGLLEWPRCCESSIVLTGATLNEHSAGGVEKSASSAPVAWRKRSQPAFDRANLNVAAFYNRGPDAARCLGSRVPSARPLTHAQQVVDICDVVFLTVSDDAILPVCRDLRWEQRHRVVHCSGATELTALDHAKSAGAVTGGFHPMQMFANPDVALEGCADAPSASKPNPISGLSWNGLRPASDANRWRCRAGVRGALSCLGLLCRSFLIALLKEGVDLWKSFGASEADALRAMMPLLRGRSLPFLTADWPTAWAGAWRVGTSERSSSTSKRWTDAFRPRARCIANWRSGMSRSGSSVAHSVLSVGQRIENLLLCGLAGKRRSHLDRNRS